MADATAHGQQPHAYGVDDTYLYHHFDDLEQQHESSTLGMWAFLCTEVLFFGGVVTAFVIANLKYPEAFSEARGHLSVWIGFVNTGVLLCSSLTMALAVRSAQLRRNRDTVLFLLSTIVFALTFLGIKAYEWYVDYVDGLVPGVRWTGEHVQYDQEILFWSFYFSITGLHAIHMIIGVAIIATMAWLVHRRWLTGGGATQVEMLGLYWHFVDIVWVFLYPILYLIQRP